MQQEILYFCAGCATGAVVAGLGMGIHGRSARKTLEQQVQEALQAASRAEAAALRASEGARQAVSAAHAAPVQAEPASPVASRRPQRRSVRSVLDERLGSAEKEGIPQIARGVERPAGEPIVARPAVPSYGIRREFDPAARAAVIDRRIPHFDQSLFPDTTAELEADVDDFELAMRAMDDTLARQAPVVGMPESEPERKEVPSFSDATSYVEYLIQDEMDRRRAEGTGRLVRKHLTVYEGTGDLSAARRKLSARYRARHLPSIAADA